MSSCLGVYVEDKLIKYAKVTRDHDSVSVDAFGIKFFDKIEDAISQVIEETDSQKVPVSINLSEETYNYFYMFSQLKKNDMKKALDTEFYAYCEEKKINTNAYESRFIIVDGVESKEKVKAIYVSCNKTEINDKLNKFSQTKVSTVAALPITIANIMQVQEKENCLIVNIEKSTTITTVIDGKIFSIHRMADGAGNFLDTISSKENSYSKAYEACKNTTIYTTSNGEFAEDTTGYLEDIMPTLYKVVQATRKVENLAPKRIDTIYVSGTGAMINNIDLYFQDYFDNTKCEVLKPYFIGNSVKINIKDYIEVNSAIALAMQGLGFGIKALNFKNEINFSTMTFQDLMTMEVGGGAKKPKKTKEQKLREKGEKAANKEQKKEKTPFKLDLNLSGGLDPTERWLARCATGVFALVVIYSGVSYTINKRIDKKYQEVADAQSKTSSEIAKVQKDIETTREATNNYISKKEELDKITNQVTEKYKNKNAIVTLLSRIMYVIPQEVVLTSIENSSGDHIIIQAQANKYEQLGYFKAILKVDGILKSDTIVSTSGEKQNGVIKVTIEGDLP